jgi:hypothetical protein
VLPDSGIHAVARKENRVSATHKIKLTEAKN